MPSGPVSMFHSICNCNRNALCEVICAVGIHATNIYFIMDQNVTTYVPDQS